MLLWVFLACGDADGPIDARDVQYNGQSLAAALDAMQPAPEEDDPDAKLRAQLQQLEERISRAELDLVDVRNNGRMPASDVVYDPRATTMDAHNLQDALDAASARIAALEAQLGDKMGEPGPGLFQIPKDNAPNSRAPNPHGAPNRAGGPPPGRQPPDGPGR